MPKDRFNFTKHAIEAVPAPARKRAMYRDTQTRGLGLLVQPTGHRSFFWYRKVQGRPSWKTIGVFPDLSIEQARTRASELNAAVARWKANEYEGNDPIERRRDLTLGILFEDYLERRLKTHSKNPEDAIRRARWQFDAYLSDWRSRKLGTIRKADVRDLHAELGEKNGKVTANRAVQSMRTLFNWAHKQEMWSGENPAEQIARYPEGSRERFVQPDEAPKLFKALSQEKNIDLRDYVLLSLFTGARRADVLSMRWEQLDLKRGLWVIPEPKNNRPHIVPLTDEAVEILKARHQVLDGEWVFPSTGKTGHLVDLKRSWAGLLKRAKIEGLWKHDLRRTLGSWQAAAGVSLPLIGKTLGHQSRDATEVYARLHLQPVKAAIELATGAMLAAGRVSKRKLIGAGKPKRETGHMEGRR